VKNSPVNCINQIFQNKSYIHWTCTPRHCVKDTVPFRLSSCWHSDGLKTNLLSMAEKVEVEIMWWSVAANPHLKTYSQIQLERGTSALEFPNTVHCRTTEKHGMYRSDYRTGAWPHCKNLVQFYKTIVISHIAWSCAQCLHSCFSRWAALWCSQLPSWNFMCTMLFSNVRPLQM